MGEGFLDKVKWDLTDDGLPMRARQRGSRIGAAFVMAMALFFCVLWIDEKGGLAESLDEGPVLLGLTLLMFLFFGGMFLFSIRYFFWQKEIVITRAMVTCSERGLSGRREWSELLSGYRGVQLRKKIRSTSGIPSIEVRICLAHGTDEKKDIVLWQKGTDEEGIDEKLAYFSELLEMPILSEKDSDGGVPVIPAPEEAGAGRDPRREYMETLNAGKGITVTRKGEGLRITYYNTSLGNKALQWMLGCVLAFFWGKFVLTAEDGGGVLMVVSIIGFMLLLFLTVDSHIGARELYVSPDEVVCARRYPWLGERRRERIPAASVKEVFVDKDIEHVNTDSGVEIRTRDRTMKIGKFLQGREKAALQKLVTHVLGITEEQGEGTTN